MDESSKYIVQITAVITGVDLTSGEYSVVSLEKDTLILPCAELSPQVNRQLILEQIYNKYVDLDVNWIIPKLTTVIENKESIAILYECMIPLDTQLKNAFWIPLWKCTSNPLSLYILKNNIE
jgi:hypothetical protein